MKMKFLSLATLAAALTMPFAVMAADAKVGEVSIGKPWARASAASVRNGAAFMALTNAGTQPDRLIKAATPVAERAELHTHLMDNGVMRMRQIEAIDLAPGAPTMLQPGGLHVMLMNLKEPLKEGSAVPLTLTFEKAGEVTVEVPVAGPGAMGPAMTHHGH
jgi:periplasmic copper chaperone A